MNETGAVDQRLDDHERRLNDLERGQARIETSLDGMSSKMSEMHGENRARAEHLERTVGNLGDQLRRLASMWGWSKWALVVGGSSFAGNLLSHFAVHP